MLNLVTPRVQGLEGCKMRPGKHEHGDEENNFRLANFLKDFCSLDPSVYFLSRLIVLQVLYYMYTKLIKF